MSKESMAANIGNLVMDFINALRDDNLEWHKKNQEIIQDVRIKRELGIEQINQEVQRLKLKFDQDMQRMEHDFQLDMQKKNLKAEADVKNYKRFIDSIEDLRDKLERFYPDMLAAQVFIIHECATQLLHEMWDSTDPREKLAGRKEFAKFLSLVTEDTNPVILEGESSITFPTLPYKTLNYIEQQDK